MNNDTNEIARHTTVALTAIKQALGQGDLSVALFISHHLDEIEASYWQKNTGAQHPTPIQVLDLLELRSHWRPEDEDGIYTFDFTLPGAVTNYVIAVRFDERGVVQSIEMES